MTSTATATEETVMCPEDGDQRGDSDSFAPDTIPVDADDEDAEERLAKSRERNREHARRTRLRKKAQLQILQGRVKQLEAENIKLRQNVEECSVASILLGMSSGNASSASPSDKDLRVGRNKSIPSSSLPPKKRQRSVSNASDLVITVKGVTTVIGGNGKTHINWKTGVYSDENGEQKKLTSEELETLRRERNRMHAKMTRDRKKKFLSGVRETIQKLEQENKDLKAKLAGNVSNSAAVVSCGPEPMVGRVSPPFLTLS